MTVYPAAETHSCNPTDVRPKSKWKMVPPPLGFMEPEDWARAKPTSVPTFYPEGSFYKCTCGRLWYLVFRGHWVYVGRWQWLRRRRARKLGAI